jgi:photosystem II stability/assembly factor-like uncharacterized protein
MKHTLVSIMIFLLTVSVISQENKISTGSERMAAWDDHNNMVEQSPLKSLPWIQIGPLLNSGRISGFVGIPGNNSIMYASAVVGGVWKTINAGTTWEPIFDDQMTQTIGDIEVCPTNPDLVWVGTGSSNLSGSAYPGSGVFKTKDGGASWEHMGLEDCQHVMRIAISPDNPDVVCVAAMGSKYYPQDSTIGLYKTNNGGKSWRKILSDGRYTGCADVVFHPSNSNIIYATTWNRKETRGHVHKTTDGGLSWEMLLNGLPEGEKIGRIGVDISLSNPDVVYAYMNNHNNFENEIPPEEKSKRAKKKKSGGLTLKDIRRMSEKKFLAADSIQIAGFLSKHGIIRSFGVDDVKKMVSSGEQSVETLSDCIEKYWPVNEKRGRNRGSKIGGEVYKTVDGGKSWEKTHQEPIYLLSSFGWSFCDIKVSPVDENEIYILGVTLQHSTDGGKTFQPNEGRQVHINPNISKFLHLDQHDLWIDPLNPKRILLGNDGGAFISYDKGSNWMHHNTIPIGMFYKIAVDMEEPYNIYGGTQDDSHVYGPSDQNLAYNAGDKWEYIWLDLWSGGDGLHIMPDVHDPNTVYYENQNGALKRKNLAENKNVGIKPKRSFCEHPLRTDWSTPFYVSTTERNTVYYGANRLFKSTNRGDSWIGISPDLTKKVEEEKKQKDKLTSISVDNSDPNLIGVGSNSGVIHITRDGGESWVMVSEDLPDSRVNSIKLSEHRKGVVYIVLSGNGADRNPYLFMSSDYGENWKSIIGNLPLEKARSIAEDPLKSGLLYVGTELGVYVSFDDGGEWTSLSHDLPAVAVDDILVHPRDNELVIGTYGRGIYKMNISYLQQLTPEIQQEELFLFDVKDAKLPKRRDYGGDWFFETGEYPEFVFFMNSGGEVKVELEDDSGEVIKTIHIDGQAGINRVEWDLISEAARYRKSAYKGGTQLYSPGKYKVSVSGDSENVEAFFKLREY